MESRSRPRTLARRAEIVAFGPGGDELGSFELAGERLTVGRLPESNVGHDYSFRPYFRQLADRDDGRFFGVGVTTGVPGYFLSKALRDDSGRLIGALVIKLDLRGLERQWARDTHTVLVSDAHGIVFLVNNPAWRYRVLAPLTAVQRGELEVTQQFPSRALRPLHSRVMESLGDHSWRVQLDEPGIAGAYLWQSLSLPREGWTVHALGDMRSSTAVGRIAGLAAARSRCRAGRRRSCRRPSRWP